MASEIVASGEITKLAECSLVLILGAMHYETANLS
jgi:hypothetical protein